MLFFLFILPLIFLVLFLRNAKPVYLVSCMLLALLHFLFSFVNVYDYAFSPLAKDAVLFHKMALLASSGHDSINSLISLILVDAVPRFTHILSIFYQFDSSQFIGQTLSIVAYSLSTVVLYYFIKLLKVERYCLLILIVFTLIPMHFINRFGVMREAWQCLFFMLAIYGLARWALENGAFRYFIYSLIFSALAASLHQGILYGLVAIYMLLFIYVFFLYCGRKKAKLFGGFVVLCMLPLLAVFFQIILIRLKASS